MGIELRTSRSHCNLFEVNHPSLFISVNQPTMFGIRPADRITQSAL
jgi:hypothetical protein